MAFVYYQANEILIDALSPDKLLGCQLRLSPSASVHHTLQTKI